MIEKARTIAQGTPRNIVTVLKHGVYEDSAFYYVDMELCDRSLEEFMVEYGPAASTETRLTTNDICGIMAQIAQAVTFIHDQGEMHGNLKPRNGISRLKRWT